MPLRDKNYLAMVRLLPCMKSGDGKCQGDVCAAHLSKSTDAGKGIKASDIYTVPLCWYHHNLQHAIGEVSFWGGMDNIYKLRGWCLEMYDQKHDIFALRRVYIQARNDLL